MKSIQLKTVFLGLSCFAFASTFAQDSPSTPKPDTTKMPKHDSTSMNSPVAMHNNVASINVNASNEYVSKNESIVALKNDAEEDVLTAKSFAKITA
ncbi:hypothetical protein FW778_20135 [Ginsengibacter hankyongi]|uniref:Uncharacterized protein n=1 Tax=Ginsengibacter hankyongi TaxID=2607284 RepID=A0A5J5ICT7_9BACT|nr:hypothetical protein [Ginsengibacter hankyongi]KAA9035866.1 hypothetical protein FW778_20135 [Ginsengibacter hankyongi]